MDSLLQSCLVHCLVEYVEENQLLLLPLTSALVVLALRKCFSRMKKDQRLPGEEANVTLEGGTGDDKEHDGLEGPVLVSRADTLSLTLAEEAIEMLSLDLSWGNLGSPAPLHGGAPGLIIPRSQIPSLCSAEPPLGVHKTEEDTCAVHRPDLPVICEDKSRAPRIDSYYKKRPSKMTFKRTVRQLGKEQSLSLSSILAAGPRNVMGLHPPVCIRRDLDGGEKVLRMQHSKSSEPLSVTAVNGVQESVTAAQVAGTKTELREPCPPWQMARSTKPRTGAASPKTRAASKRHLEPDSSVKSTEMKAGSGHQDGCDGVKAPEDNNSVTSIETQVSAFVRGLQRKVQEALTRLSK